MTSLVVTPVTLARSISAVAATALQLELRMVLTSALPTVSRPSNHLATVDTAHALPPTIQGLRFVR